MTAGSEHGDQRHQTRRLKLEARRRVLSVSEIVDLSSLMRRIVLTSPDLSDFESPSADDHVKLFFKVEGAAEPAARDFTPRAYDQAACTLTIDFALHDAGPASDWARGARVGDVLSIGGPRGSTVVADDFDWYFFVGDETALPSIGRRLSELPKTAKALAVILVEDAAQEIDLDAKCPLDLRWVHRAGNEGDDAQLLTDVVKNIGLPSGDGFIFIAAEAVVAKALKAVALEGLRHPAQWLKAAGYWRRGDVGTHEPL